MSRGLSLGRFRGGGYRRAKFSFFAFALVPSVTVDKVNVICYLDRGALGVYAKSVYAGRKPRGLSGRERRDRGV